MKPKKHKRPENLNIIEKMPNELLPRILSHCSFQELKKLMLLNKEWLYKVLNNFMLWKIKGEKYNLTEYQDTKEIIQQIRKKYLIKKYWAKGVNECRYTVGTNQCDITHLQVSNKIIACSSDDHTIKIFDLKGKLMKTLIGHLGGVWTFMFNDEFLVSGSVDKSIRIWDIKKGWTLKVLNGHRSTVRCLKITDEYIVSGSRDSEIRVWKMDGTCVHVLCGHTESVRCLDLDKELLVTGSYDGSVCLWNYKEGVLIKKLKSHLLRVYSVILGRKYIASGGKDAIVYVYLRSGELKYTFKGHRSIVAWLNLSLYKDQERYLLTAGADGQICKWDLWTGDLIYKIENLQFVATKFVINDILIVGTSNSVKMYDFSTGKFIRNIIDDVAGVYKIACVENKLVVAYSNEQFGYLGIFSYRSVC